MYVITRPTGRPFYRLTADATIATLEWLGYDVPEQAAERIKNLRIAETCLDHTYAVTREMDTEERELTHGTKDGETLAGYLLTWLPSDGIEPEHHFRTAKDVFMHAFYGGCPLPQDAKERIQSLRVGEYWQNAYLRVERV